MPFRLSLVWFCDQCSQGPYGNWQNVCPLCGHKRCSACAAEEAGEEYYSESSLNDKYDIYKPRIPNLVKVVASETHVLTNQANKASSDERNEVDEPQTPNLINPAEIGESASKPEVAINDQSQPTGIKEGVITTPYRLHWVCSCGYKHYDDFVEFVPDSMIKLVDGLKQNGVESLLLEPPTDSIYVKLYSLYLSIRNPAVRLKNSAIRPFRSAPEQSSSTPSTPASTRPDGNTSSWWTAQRGQNIVSSARPRASSGNQSNNPSTSVRTTTAQQGPISTRNDFMLLCSDQNGWLTTWEGLNVSQIKSDRDLFENFHTSLNGKKRWMRRYMSLKTVQQISFVKFALRRGQEVDQLQFNEIPPLAETHYDFFEREPGYIPPIGNNYFMHRFSSPAHCKDDVFCLSQIPKRVNRRPTYGSSPDYFTAWGLYFEDALDLKRMCFCGAVAFVLSLVFGVVWAVETGSIQNGFAIGSYMLAFEALTVGTVQVAVSLE